MDVRVTEKVIALQDRIINETVRGKAPLFVQYSLAFIFFFYGLQKVAPGATPVFQPIEQLLLQLPISPETATVINIIGTYELLVGLLLGFGFLRIAFFPFLIHQVTTQAVIIVFYDVYFVQPYLDLHFIEVPWLIGSFAAFAMKNIVFIAAFILLCSHEFDFSD